MNFEGAIDAALSALEHDCDTFWDRILANKNTPPEEADHAAHVIAGTQWLLANRNEIIANAQFDHRDNFDEQTSAL